MRVVSQALLNVISLHPFYQPASGIPGGKKNQTLDRFAIIFPQKLYGSETCFHLYALYFQRLASTKIKMSETALDT